MSQIFWDKSERFDPQIHTEEKQLTVNMNKHFEVYKKSFDLFGHLNKFTSWMFATGRINQGVGAKRVMKANKSISDNAYRVKYNGALFLPTYAFGKCQIGTLYTATDDMTGLTGAVAYTAGITSGTVAHNVIGSIAIKHDPDNNVHGQKFHEGDVIALGDYRGSRFIVMGTPRLASTSDHYIVDFKVSSPAALFAEAHLAAGELIPEAGNAFGEGSNKGYMRERRVKWKINYSWISRVTATMTGSAMSQQVAIISNKGTGAAGASMWEYEVLMDLHQRHTINLELAARYSRTSMDASSHEWFENYGTNLLTLTGFTADYGLVAPVIGDGWIAQLDDSLSIGYDVNAALDVELLEHFMTILAQRGPIGAEGNTFVILGDKLSHMKFDKAMKLLVGYTADSTAITHNTNLVFNASKGKEIEVGFSVSRYYYLKNKLVFIEDDLMNNPAFASQNGGIVGTGIMYFLNATLVNGVSNIDLIARKSRALRAKYIDGIHSLNANRDNSAYAASGFDGARYDLLSEYLPVIYSTESCGILYPTNKYDGGPLNGITAITDADASSWHY